ncbi:MAG: hypothetical protein EBT48_00365 [Verrucomicrobia bacterium]|nr:hypothetical protein [Verrucomicrobiota bacterium]
MDIESKIIELLNEADSKMSQQEFSSLAESVIDYIDEIGRSKKASKPTVYRIIGAEAAELIDKIDAAIKRFGTYSYDDKGPYEVMNMKEIMTGLQSKPVKEIGKIPSHPDVREWRKKAVAWQRRAIRIWLDRFECSGASFAEVEGVRNSVVSGKSVKWQLRGGWVRRSQNKLFWIRDIGRIAKRG